tara:strand:- start:129 stop:389 length:261 start_codon:yes stop_codon:yes gene_type:complete
MTKFILLPFILVGCTAPITDPPAHANLEQDYNTLMIWARKNVEYERNKVRVEGIEDDIYKALMEFENGSDDTTEQEVLLQLPSDQH